MKRSLILLFALTLVLAACAGTAELPTNEGGDDAILDGAVTQGACAEDEPDCDDTVSVDAPRDLPPADDGGAAGTCLEGTGDCNDTPGTPLEPLPVDDGASSGMVPIEGGLTVAEALEGAADGVVAVKGFIVATDNGVSLCEALAESFPPQCGGAALTVEGLAIDEYPVEEEGSTRWTNDTVVLFGEVTDGTLVVDHTVSG